MENVLLTWALYYQNLGLSLIPLKGKIPLIPWKEFQTRRANEKEIKEWWEKYPNGNIGILTGPITGRLILDIDGEAGQRSIKPFSIPVTQTVRTRRGYQIHFKWVGDVGYKTTVAGILPGVDVRGDGGIGILPPSFCSDGTRYEWINDTTKPLAEPPQWLLDLLNKPIEKDVPIGPQESWLKDIVGGVGVGRQHDSLIRLAGYYFNSFPPDVAILHLREWNTKNTPPMEEKDFENQLKDLKQRFLSGEYQTLYKEPRKLELLSSSNLVKNFSKPPEWLVPGLIPKNTRTIFSGWQGRGKSFATTDLVIEVSRKSGVGFWLDEFPVMKGPVIYIDNENGKNLVAYRMEQLLKPKGLKAEDLNLHWIIGQHIKITSERDLHWLREQVKQVKPVLIVLDSLASAHNLDENSSKDMRILFDDMLAPFCEEFQCGVLAIDHEAKGSPGVDLAGGKRLRGSGAKGDAVDTLLALNETNGMTFVECAKSRYSRRHAPFIISIDPCSEGVVVRYGGELSNV